MNETPINILTHTTLMRRIMYRTYYAFVIHMATRPLVRYGVPLVLLTYLAAKLIFVAAVIANAKAVGISHFYSFALSAITHTNIFTFLVLSALTVVFVGIARDATLVVVPKRHYA